MRAFPHQEEQQMTLNELFKNTTYDDTLFSVEDKSTIESRIFMKSVRGSEVTRQSARLGGMNLYLRLQLKMPASQAW